jgi:hypothetical protein
VGVADRQWGVISRAQLVACVLEAGSIDYWVRTRRLHKLHRRVYALGHRRLTEMGWCTAALLYAGADAVLSHLTAAWAWGLVDVLPSTIDVTTARRLVASRGLRLHHAGAEKPTLRKSLSVTPVPRTLLDCAAVVEPGRLAALVREADYRRLLDPQAALALCGRGRTGSAALKLALELHLPELAYTRSELEVRFLELCRRAGLPPPAVNVRVAGILVDAVWRDRGLVVELDGRSGHATPAGLRRDRDRDMRLRGAGFRVIRYTWHQVTAEPHRVIADLRRLPAG